MLTRKQRILIKRAQAQAGVSDPEYRALLAGVTRLPSCRSSKDDRLTDEHFDAILKFFEAIYWHQLDPAAGGTDIFPSPGWWASRNVRGNTTRDRFALGGLHRKIQAAESVLLRLGKDDAYLAAIRRRAGSSWAYWHALMRTAKHLDTASDSSDQPDPSEAILSHATA